MQFWAGLVSSPPNTAYQILRNTAMLTMMCDIGHVRYSAGCAVLGSIKLILLDIV